MKKFLFALLLCFLSAGCTQWRTDNRPETPEERQCVADLELKILNSTPGSLAGHDQDWDDAIAMAHKVAERTCCKERLYEFKPFDGYTGRWKEVPK